MGFRRGGWRWEWEQGVRGENLSGPSNQRNLRSSETTESGVSPAALPREQAIGESQGDRTGVADTRQLRDGAGGEDGAVRGGAPF